MANTKSVTLDKAAGQYLYCVDSASLSSSGIGIEIWIKPNTVSIDQYLASKNGSLAGSDFAYSVLLKSDNKLRFAYSKTGSDVYFGDSTGTISVSAWTHVVINYDNNTGQLQFYINTVLDSSQTLSAGALFNNTRDFHVGAQGGSQTFDGLIDELRIWNTPRSSGQITANYMRELAGNESELQAYWKFNDNYNDTSSNGNTLSPSGLPVFTTDVPFDDSTTTSTSTTSTSSSTTTTSTSTSTTTTSTSTSSSTSTSRTTSTSTTSTSTTSTITTTSTTTTSTSTTSTSTSTTSTSSSTTTSTSTSTSTTITMDLKLIVEKAK